MSDNTDHNNLLESSLNNSDSDSDSNSSSSSSSDTDSSSSDDESGQAPAAPDHDVGGGAGDDHVPGGGDHDLDLGQDDQRINSWGLDDIQQFLSDTIPDSGVSGPVDPVFVNHEDSSHATHMDSLVFDPGLPEQEMNEPRLESVCNSTINSAENSIIMENDFDDDLPINDDLVLDNHINSESHNSRDTDHDNSKTKKRKMKQDIVQDDSEEQSAVAKVPPKKCKMDEPTHDTAVSPPLPQSESDSASYPGHTHQTPPPPPPPPADDPDHSTQKPSKKLSLKDYKAKKEAERLRASSDSCESQESSKESSPGRDLLQLETLENVKSEQSDAFNDGSVDTEKSEQMHGFDILDELEDIESDNDQGDGYDEDEDSDSLAEDEIDKLLEASVKNPGVGPLADIQPDQKLKKLILEERGHNMFEVLPEGWMSVTHNSGIPLYLHRESRVVTVSKPYDLGNGSVRKHNIPISAIPCYAYKYYGDNKQKSPESKDTDPSPPPPPSSAPPPSCPYSSSSSFRENASPDSTTDNRVSAIDPPQPSSDLSSTAASPPPSTSSLQSSASVTVPATNDANNFPKAEISTIEESMKQSELTPADVTNYCKKIFVFKELEVAKFKSWKERRAYFKQSHKKKYV